jgi:hypothetical protein
MFSLFKWRLELGVAGTILNRGDTVGRALNAAVGRVITEFRMMIVTINVAKPHVWAEFGVRPKFANRQLPHLHCYLFQALPIQ